MSCATMVLVFLPLLLIPMMTMAAEQYETQYPGPPPTPPPPPPPHPHPTYVENGAPEPPRPAYVDHGTTPSSYIGDTAPPHATHPPPYVDHSAHEYPSTPAPVHYQEHRQQYPEHAPPPPPPLPHYPLSATPAYPERPVYNTPRFVYENPPTTHRPAVIYPSFEALPPRRPNRPAAQTPRPTTTERPTTTTPKPTPKWDTEYNYPERLLPLKGCFYNAHGYACCNLPLQHVMEELADVLLNNGTFHRCNVQKLANELQEKCQTTFGSEFEAVVGLSDFAERIHFRQHYVCKIEVNGRYMLAWATPDDRKGQVRVRRAGDTDEFDDDEIHEYNF